MKDSHIRVVLTSKGREALEKEGLAIKPFMSEDMKCLAIKAANEGRDLTVFDKIRQSLELYPLFERVHKN